MLVRGELEGVWRWLWKARPGSTNLPEEGVKPVDLLLREAACNGLGLCLIQCFHGFPLLIVVTLVGALVDVACLPPVLRAPV